MITHIRMKNFKSWKDSGEVKLAPLTGFFGTNSSGKSSLLQMLLLLKQTAEQKETKGVIFFGDENSLVNLGSFREVIHGHNVEEALELGFGCKLQELLTIKTFQQIDKFRQQYEFAALDIDSFIYDTSIRENTGSMSIEYFSYTVGPEDIQKIKWKNGNLFYGDWQKGPVNVTKCYGPSESGYIELLRPLSSAFEYLFKHVYPLGTTLVHPQRLYHWEGTDPDSVGQSGEDMIDSLLNARVDQVKTSYEGRNVPIEERISWWLREMDLAHSFSLQRANSGTDRNYEVRIQKTSASPPVTLVDMGYGLFHFLPVLVLCYYTPECSTLILEQPGIHLHPKVQSQLADLLIEVVNERNLQILVESHSEHLLTRLQRRIVEEKIAVDQTAFYFCRNDEGVSEIEKLDVDEASGDIKNWPVNFFGDVMGDMVAMTDKQVESITEKGTEG